METGRDYWNGRELLNLFNKASSGLKKLGDSLLTRCSKCSDLMGDIEGEIGDKKDSPDGQRASRPLLHFKDFNYVPHQSAEKTKPAPLSFGEVSIDLSGQFLAWRQQSLSWKPSMNSWKP